MAFSNRLVDSQPSASLIMFQGLCFGTQFGRQVFGYFVLIIGQLLWTYNFGCICLFWVSWLNQGGSSVAQGLCWLNVHVLVLQQVLVDNRYENHGGLVL